ncbi:MAG: GAF domain-containing protein [Magnetococcales bacterium]|nr:GAF domain-containing protein [Magnetococcales bacterium]
MRPDDGLETLLHQIVRLSMAETEADRGSILVLNECGMVTHKVLARPGQLPEVARVNVALVLTEGLGGWVIRNRRGDLIRDTNFDDRWVDLPDDLWETGSALAVPVIWQDHILALITLQHQDKLQFNDSHLSRVELIAQRVAELLETARRQAG